MRKNITRLVNGWLKNKKDLLIAMFFDIFANFITLLLLFTTWHILVSSAKLLKIDYFINKFIILNNYVLFILIIWFCISTIFITTKHIKFIFTAVNIMEKRLNEEI